jgi:SAM-dependent methyltransferase
MVEIDAEFDSYSDSYRDQHQASINFGGIELDYFAEYKAQVAQSVCKKNGLTPEVIMDFGAGIGNAVRPLRSAFPNAQIKCVDVSAESLKQCSSLNVDACSVYVYDGTHIPFESGSIDLAFTACVFHHIPAEDHVRLLAEIRRCLSPNGLLVLFEHNPLNPLTQLAVARCPFDEHAVLINSWTMQKRFHSAGFSKASFRFRIFFPGFLQALRGLEKWLEPVPLGGQYYVTGSV